MAKQLISGTRQVSDRARYQAQVLWLWGPVEIEIWARDKEGMGSSLSIHKRRLFYEALNPSLRGHFRGVLT